MEQLRAPLAHRLRAVHGGVGVAQQVHPAPLVGGVGDTDARLHRGFSGRIDGFEVLARWTHSRLGPVSPEVFIPMAEQLGLIRQLGAQVLEQGHAAGVVLWERCGRAFTVGVNISPAQVTDPDLLARVGRLMTAAPEVHLVLELTEGTLLADDAETSAALTALQAAGAGLAVDDFGVGYSSIGYLHRLPVTILKIDKSFIAGLWDDRARTLVQW